MARRLNYERQLELEPKRIQFAIQKISELGYEVVQINDTQIQFTYQGKAVNFWPYSGWASGVSIQDGRGLKNLLKQLK